MSNITDEFMKLSPYYFMDNEIDEATMGPIFIYTLKSTKEKFKFKIPRIDIEDFNSGIKSPKINEMFIELKSILRDRKIDNFIA
jgi:hypothetical protein